MEVAIIILYILAFALGASFGSFFGVLVDRLPRKESIINPPSHCTNCGHKLRWYENIPVISYLIQAGKCRNCESKIPLRFFFVELFMGILLVLIASILISQILQPLYSVNI